ncbi:MAG: hypothetical protein ACPG4Z_01520 [Chitinophagales bacterium]
MEIAAWFIGLGLCASGGIRLILTIAAFIGLKGANKLGTAKGDQVQKNEDMMAGFKKKILIYGAMVIVGAILLLVFK